MKVNVYLKIGIPGPTYKRWIENFEKGIEWAPDEKVRAWIEHRLRGIHNGINVEIIPAPITYDDEPNPYVPRDME